MRLYNRSTLRAFWEQHSTAEEPLRRWYKDVKNAAWKGPADIKNSYSSASFIGSDRVVFNIGGNSYRLICRIDYRNQVVQVRFLGTHAAYNQVDAATV
ncbi:MAG TPA: type II toxin-antitoxin system HigB family toxin [Myxococcota bacterium]|nr:type II toxin-antitoxin system HigB family toxin [Myxococcota bacterium]HND33208.1 type II toxin-antitoxin system HigB family toxin [Myxococcota bacterium]HNH50374.1 type II toxin-antitoxin system HigB family toxin [Myxococcota bacterium]